MVTYPAPQLSVSCSWFLVPGTVQLWLHLFLFSYVLSLAIHMIFYLLLTRCFFLNLWWRIFLVNPSTFPLCILLLYSSFILSSEKMFSLLTCFSIKFPFTFMYSLRPSSMLSIHLSLLYLLKYNFPRLNLGWKAPFIAITFQVLTSITLTSCIVQSMIQAEYQMAPTAHV